MRIYALFIFLIVVLLLVLGVIHVFHNSPPCENAEKYVSHSTIWIDGNEDFLNQSQAEGWPGNGTAENPITIENYDIQAGEKPGIEIQNTNLYFKINNCYIHNAQWDGKYGIILINVSNGKISGSEFYYNENGAIYLENSNNIEIRSNYCHDTPDEYGLIEIHSSKDIQVENNTVENDNFAGIYVVNSLSLSIQNNTVGGTDVEAIMLYNVSNSTIYHNDISYPPLGNNFPNYGIYIGSGSAHNAIKNNTVRSSSTPYGMGIYLSSVENNTFIGNEIFNTGYGVSISSSNFNLFCYNNIHNNTKYGITILSGSQNEIYGNIFRGNNGAGDTYNGKIQASDNGTDNKWFTVLNGHGYGNYWYDWANNNDTNDMNNEGIVDYPYHISGQANSVDEYPLKNYHTIPEINLEIFIFFVPIIAIITKYFKI